LSGGVEDRDVRGAAASRGLIAERVARRNDQAKSHGPWRASVRPTVRARVAWLALARLASARSCQVTVGAELAGTRRCAHSSGSALVVHAPAGRHDGRADDVAHGPWRRQRIRLRGAGAVAARAWSEHTVAVDVASAGAARASGAAGAAVATLTGGSSLPARTGASTTMSTIPGHGGVTTSSARAGRAAVRVQGRYGATSHGGREQSREQDAADDHPAERSRRHHAAGELQRMCHGIC
jgi:hypothetical protein